MKVKLTILVFVLFSNVLLSQVGFKNLYDFGGLGASFHDMIIENDTIYAFGSIISPDTYQTGLLFAKLDTLGLIYSHTIHYDSLGASYSFGVLHEMIKTNDGGFAVVGTVINRHAALLVKLNVAGEVEFMGEHQDTSVFTIHHRNLIETTFGYISIGDMQQKDDYKSDAFAIAWDFEGNFLWEFNYGEFGVYDLFRDIKPDNDHLLISSIRSNGGTGNNNFQFWHEFTILEINSEGSLVNENSLGKQFYDGYLSYPSKWIYDVDGNYIHYGYRIEVFSSSDAIRYPSIVARDSDFNVIWETNFHAIPNTYNYLRAINHTNDGGYLIAGMNQRLSSLNEYYQASFIAKVNSNGDSLWTRLDTINFELARPILVAVDDLSSGSIVGCGEVIRSQPTPKKSFAYLMKVDKNGCLLEDCPLISSNLEVEKVSEVICYPNPANDFIMINSEEQVEYQLYNEIGQVLMRGKAQEEMIEIDHLIAGNYFIKFTFGNSTLTKLIVKRSN